LKDYEKSLTELKSEFLYRLNTFKFEMNEKRSEKLKKTEDYLTEMKEDLKKTVNGKISDMAKHSLLYYF